jgi:hypothetical protein
LTEWAGTATATGRASYCTSSDAQPSRQNSANATVSLQSVDGQSASDLAGAKLCVSPDAVTTVAGNAPEAKPGHHACGNAGDELTLFYAPPNGDGGTFTDTGELALRWPHVGGAGPVTATLAVAVG